MILCILLGIISILYGCMIMRIGSGTSFFLIWFAIGIAFFVLGLAVHFHWLSAIPKALRAVLAVLIAAGVLTLAVTGGLIGSHMKDAGKPDLDYIIVLGAQVKYAPGNGAAVSDSAQVESAQSDNEVIPSTVLTFRLDTALSYLQDNPRTVCVVSGGQGPAEPAAEAPIMRDYLVAHGIDAGRILVEDQSMTTAENLRLSQDAIEADRARRHDEAASASADTNASGASKDPSVGIVTNNFHIYRGIRIAEHTGFTNVCGIAAPSTPFYLPHNMLHEMLAVVKDKAVGNL